MSDPERRIKIEVTDDRSTARVTFLPSSGASGSLDLNLEQLTAVIDGLGKVRGMMAQGLPVPELEGQHVHAVFNTIWYINSEPLTDGSALTFYHPNFGIVAFVVPRDQVEGMTRLLTAHLNNPRQPRGKPN